MKLVLDPDRSSVRVRTFAEGLFSRLAHDLELSCRDLSGSAERASETEGTATIVVPIAKIDVAGTVKAGRVDPEGLSSSDRASCLEKMRKDVFHANDGAVHVSTKLESAKQARVSIMHPKGRTLERSVRVDVTSEESAYRVTGTFELSLAAIGSDPVKGPMNAFRMKDKVEIFFDVVFCPA